MLRSFFYTLLFISNLFFGSALSAVTQSATEIVFKEEISELMLAGDTWRFSNGDAYTGQWLNNKPHGQGTYQRLNGDAYEGLFRKGLMEGEGTYRFASGDEYVGAWVQGLATGYGEMKYQNGNNYKGQWLKGLRHGKGRLEYRSGSIFEGQWIEDVKQGKGLMTYRNGDRYIGDYKNNKPHGHGIKTGSNGEVYRGTFSKGVKHGVGECNYDGGDMRICLFDKGNEIRDRNKLELAQQYYEKHQPKYEFEGGIAYQLQDEYTKARYYITTENVWWEKDIALLQTDLRIRSETDKHFLSLTVNRYTGPGVYHLRKGDVLASSNEGAPIELIEDGIARIEIKQDERGEIIGEFTVPQLSSQDDASTFKIFDGRFEAQKFSSANIPKKNNRNEKLKAMQQERAKQSTSLRR